MNQKLLTTLLLVVVSSISNAGDPIPVAELKRTDPVDFDKEVLPMLRQNCLACHNSTDAEGDVVLESVAKIMESESVVAGKPAESALLSLSAHQDDPVMPPEDNEVKAKNMTSEQLGLIKLWIAQGAKPSANSSANKVNFAKLPPGINPVYSLAMSSNGQYLAAGRANQIFVYQVPSKQLMTRVTDPELQKSSIYNQAGIAHLDLVQSLVFGPNNRTFVSGGFRNVKVWQKTPATSSTNSIKFPEPITASNSSNGQNLIVLGGQQGGIAVVDSKSKQLVHAAKIFDQPVDLVAVNSAGTIIAAIKDKKSLVVYDLNKKALMKNAVSLETDAVSIAFVKGEESVVVGQSNHSISIFDLKSILAAKEPTEIKPSSVLAGHAQPPHLLHPFGENHSMLLAGSNNGNAKVWDLASGKQIRTVSHGSAICSIEVSEDHTRLATCGTNGSLKIWDATNGKLINEVRGDSNVDFQIAENDRLVRLKQQLIDAAKSDLDNGNKEKVAEEANVKKTKEALSKADEDTKKKLEAKTKADADYAAANKVVESKKAEVAAHIKSKTEIMTEIKMQKERVNSIVQAVAVLGEETARVNSIKSVLNERLKSAADALAKDKENANLKKDVARFTSDIAFSETMITRIAAQTTKTNVEKKAAEEKAKSLEPRLMEIDKLINAANAEIKKQEPGLKTLVDAQKKATDAHNVAVRNSTLAKNSVERAETRAKKAADQIPVLTAAQAAAVAAKAESEKLALEFKTANEKSLTALNGIRLLSKNRLAYYDQTGRIGLCDIASGEKIESVDVTATANRLCFSTGGDELIWIAKDGTQSETTRLPTEWKLVRTIGNIDDEKTFADRVTALDISADGKYLATGSGEPSRSGQIKIWNLIDGSFVKEISDAHSDTILDLRFSPDGKKIASSSSDRFMKTFDVDSGKLIRVFEGHTHHVMSVDWNPIGRELTTAGADNVVKVWDAGTGTQKRTIAGYSKEVTSLCFIELTNEVLTGSGDHSVRRKRTNNGGEVRSFGGSTDFVYAVASSSDGKKLAAGGQDSVVRVWTDNGQIFAEFSPPKE